MSSRTPFRSHLLQQWTQQGRRPPAAAVPWLRPSGERNHNSTHHHRQQQHGDDPRSSSSSEHSSNEISGDPSSCRTLSSIDSSFSWSNGLWQSSSIHHRSVVPSQSSNRSNLTAAAFSTAAAATTCEDVEEDEAPPGQTSDVEDVSIELNSLLLSRRTAAKPLVFTTSDDTPDLRTREIDHLRKALDRAVQAAQMAPNHKRTEPFTFTRFWSGSQAATALADISYEVSFRKQQSEPVARKKREKWSRIPAFLVATVHDNQRPLQLDEPTSDLYSQLEYAPPGTNRQLEDYASTSAAIQNVLLSLHADSIASKWATGPVISTVAFRHLVNAAPADRIVGLIMVGGRDSAELVNEREEEMTSVRRRRRRALCGDVLLELP